MSKSHIFKHLSYTLSRASFLVSSLSNLKPKCKFLPKPNIPFLFFKQIPISSYHHNVTSSTSHHTPSIATDTHTDPSSSSYFAVRIHCPNRDVADVLSEALLCFGASSVSMDQQDDDFDSSSEICIDSTFPEHEDVDVCLSQAADSIGLKETLKYEVKMGEQYEWVQKTQDSFLPVEVAEGLWIVPEWRSAPDIRATNIILNPGLAFGTGEHPTTKLCLLLLRGIIKGGEHFLDYGTGSGVLAIAALKDLSKLVWLLVKKAFILNGLQFGAAFSVGVDVDPQAITSASHNVALNNIGPEQMELRLVPSETSSSEMIEDEIEKYDVVIANILLNPLLELADHIVSCAKPGAVVAVSGILCEQVPYILDRYSALLEDLCVSEMDEWACVSGRKKSKS